MTEGVGGSPWSLLLVMGAIVALIAFVFKAGSWKGIVDKKLLDFERFTEKVETKLEDIILRLGPPPVVAARSPVQLTDFGRQLSEALGVKDWADLEAEKLLPDARGKEPFEVFNLCKRHVAGQITSDPTFKRGLREGAYMHGTKLEDLRLVYEVELRDALLIRLEPNLP